MKFKNKCYWKVIVQVSRDNIKRSKCLGSKFDDFLKYSLPNVVFLKCAINLIIKCEHEIFLVVQMNSSTKLIHVHAITMG